MKIYAEGMIDAGLNALGVRLSPVYLFSRSRRAALFDAGISLLGPVYHKNARKILGERREPPYLFLTHSHWDHCGALSCLKGHLPGLRICGHASITGLFQKNSVIEMIRLFNAMITDAYKKEHTGIIHFTPEPIDEPLQDGSAIDLGGAQCITYATPGHTRDSLSYYIPEYGILFSGEALGVPEGKHGEGVQVEFLSSYEDYLQSISRLAALKPEVICMGHEWVFTQGDAAAYFEKSYHETLRYRALIERYLHDANGDIDIAIQQMTQKEYDEKGTIYQPRFAYVANLSVQIKLIAAQS